MIADEAGRFRRLAVGIMCALCTGTIYAFGLLTNQMKVEFNLSQEDLATITTCGIVLQSFSFPAGALYDRYGTRKVIAFGGLLMSLGFGGYGLILSGAVAGTVVSLSILTGMACFASCFLDVSVIANLALFPLNRGDVMILQKTFIGLSSSVLSVLQLCFFGQDYGAYCWMLSAFVVVAGGASAIVINDPPQSVASSPVMTPGAETTCWHVYGDSPYIPEPRTPTLPSKKNEISFDRCNGDARATAGDSVPMEACAGNVSGDRSHVAPSPPPPATVSNAGVDATPELLASPADPRRLRIGFVVLAATFSLVVTVAMLNAYVVIPVSGRILLGVFCCFLLAAWAFLPNERVARRCPSWLLDASSNTITPVSAQSPPLPSTGWSPSTLPVSLVAPAVSSVPPPTNLVVPSTIGTPGSASHSNNGSDHHDDHHHHPEETHPLRLQHPQHHQQELHSPPQPKPNANSFWQNLRRIDLWLMVMWTCAIVGAGNTINSNATQVYRAANGNRFDARTNAFLMCLAGVGSASGRALTGVAAQRWSRTGRSITFLVPVPPVLIAVSLMLFLVLPVDYYGFAYVVFSSGFGVCAATVVLATKQMYACDIGKHLHFMSAGGMVGVIGFNKLLFSTLFDMEARRQKMYPQCDGKSCFQTAFFVLGAVNLAATGVGLVVHWRWMRGLNETRHHTSTAAH